MESENQNKSNDNSSNLGIDEIELRYIKKFLIRNIKLLTSLLFAGFMLSVIYALKQKDVWKGEFQIVVEEKNTNPFNMSLMNNDIPIISELGTNNFANQLSTEVEILKSPSVLMSVFDFVKKEKKQEKLSFRNWRKNLSIELEKGTSVLNLEYNDTERSLILPVLNKISEKYQEYSGKKQKNQIKKSLNYLNNQINIFSLKSKNSLDLAQQFSIENELPLLPIGEINNNLSPNQEGDFIENNPEEIRVEESNNLKIIDIKLLRIANLETPLEILAFAKTLPNYENNELIEAIEDSEIMLARNKSIYKEGSIEIKNDEKNSEILSKFLKNFIIEDLQNRRNIIEARKRAFEKKVDIIVRYQNLWKEAKRNNRILNELESQTIVVQLDQAKEKDPWNLITKPTLYDKRIFPIRRKIVAQWLIYSSIFALLFSYIKEKVENKIHKKTILENLVPFNLIDTFPSDFQVSWEDNINLFAKSNPFKKGTQKIGIITFGGGDNLYFKILLEQFVKSFSDKSFCMIDDLYKINETQEQIILLKTSSLSKDQLEQFFKKLKLQETSIIGWFLLD